MSIGSLLYRAHELKTISESFYRKSWMFLSAQGFRKREPDCGVTEETPVLLLTMMRNFVKDNPLALSELKITRERFIERYPQLGGLIV